MNIKNIIFVVLIALITSFTTQALTMRQPRESVTHSAFDRIMTSRTLKCAYIPYPPYFDIDPNTHEMHGVVYDLMEEVGRKLDLKIVWSEETAWGSMIEGLKTQRYDAVCSAIWQNATRAVHADFSIPIGYATVDAWTRADDSRFVNEITSFNKSEVRISTVDGEMGDILARDLFAKAQRVSLPQNAPFSDVLLQVAAGKADIALVEPAIANDFMKTHPGSLKNITAGNSIAVFPITIMLPKNDERLKSMIDSAINEILYTRKLDVILAKNKADSSIFFKPARPF